MHNDTQRSHLVFIRLWATTHYHATHERAELVGRLQSGARRGAALAHRAADLVVAAPAARMAARPSARRRRERTTTAGGGRDGVRMVARGRGPSRAFRLSRDQGGDRARPDARRPAGGDAARGAVLS